MFYKSGNVISCRFLISYLVSLWRIKVVRVGVYIYILTFLVILPILLFRIRHSLYFYSGDSEAEHNRLMTRNEQRLEEANRYFNTVDVNSLPIAHGQNDIHKHSADIVISIVTTHRKLSRPQSFKTNYLTQVAWKILTLLDKEKKNGFKYDVHLSICNVDRNVASYREAKFLEKFIPTFKRFHSIHFSMVHSLEKEKQDYVYCLNSSMNAFRNVSYVLLIEDDAYPREEFFPILQHTLDRHLQTRWNHGEIVQRDLKNVAYVKFYHPDWLLGFNRFGTRRITDLFGLSMICATLFMILYKFCINNYNHCSKSVIFVWIFSFIYFVLLFYAIGRVNLNALRRYFMPHLHIFVPAPSCCTPAMLFPVEAGRRVVSFLDGVRCENNYGKDSVLDDLIRKESMVAYMVEPNIVDHIGLYSSLREKFVAPFLID